MPRRAFRNNIFVLSLKFYSIKTLHSRNTLELLKRECRMNELRPFLKKSSLLTSNAASTLRLATNEAPAQVPNVWTPRTSPCIVMPRFNTSRCSFSATSSRSCGALRARSCSSAGAATSLLASGCLVLIGIAIVCCCADCCLFSVAEP
ncbi:hypothetical protein KCV00_g402, partial [Aureobasidium melanogenum]